MRVGQGVILFLACTCVSVYACIDIWPERHANTPGTAGEGSVSGVNVSSTAYLEIIVLLLGCPRGLVLCLSVVSVSVTITTESSLCQVETNSMKEGSVQPS